MSYEFTTPVGRLVQGDAFEAQTKDQAGKPLVDKQNQPTKRWFLGVAFAKDNPEFGAWYQGLLRQAMTDWPHLFDQQTGQCRAGNFAFKVVDGDGFDQAGQSWNTREGFAGHWVVRFTSGFPIKVFYEGRYDPMAQVQDPTALKRGYYVRVFGNAKGNGDQSKPGMYVNAQMVEIVGAGPIIVGGPDPAAAFAQRSGYVPQGMQPLGQAPHGMPGQQMAPMPGQMAGPGPQIAPQGQMMQQGPQMAPQAAPGPQIAPQGQMMQQGPQMAPQGQMAPQMAPQGQMMHQQLPGMGAAPGQVAAPMTPQANAAPMTPQAYAPQPGAAPGVIQGQAAPVDPNFANNAMGQQQQAYVPQMGPNSQGYDYATWKAQGHSDEQLRAWQVIL